jgi:uncharacterized protein YjbI with pentapeptide repeats
MTLTRGSREATTCKLRAAFLGLSAFPRIPPRSGNPLSTRGHTRALSRVAVTEPIGSCLGGNARVVSTRRLYGAVMKRTLFMVALVALLSLGVAGSANAKVYAGCDIKPQTKCVNAELSYLDLTGSALSGANLKGSDLRGTNLSDSTMTRANLSDTNMKWAKFLNAFLRGINVDRANMTGANFTGADLHRTNLSRASSLKNAIFDNADLSRANLSGQNLAWPQRWTEGTYGASLGNFIGANLFRANLSRSTYVNLSGAKNVIGINLSYSVIEGSDLTNINLTGANLSYADLSVSQYSDVSGSLMVGANFTGANLRKAILSTREYPSNLTNANFTNADMRGANLRGADITGANLTGAKMKGATMPDGSTHP